MRNSADLPPPDSPEAWLRRAHADLALARAGRRAKGTLPEDICYHAQQAAEKAIKAVLIAHKIDFPWVHALERLLDLCEEAQIPIPRRLQRVINLSDYASITRYPGDYENQRRFGQLL